MEIAVDQLDDNQKELFYKAKAYKENPQAFLISEAEAMMDADQLEKFQIVKKMIEAYQSGGSMDQFVPAEYKSYYDGANTALETAKELKKRKDELQLMMITKAIDPIWALRDPENKGYISKDQCCEMV